MTTPAPTTTQIPEWQKTLTAVLDANKANQVQTPAPAVSSPAGPYSTPYIPGVTATAPKAPVSTQLPGVGTLTTIPKNPLQTPYIPGVTAGGNSTPYIPGVTATPPPTAASDAGLFARTGVTPPKVSATPVVTPAITPTSSGQVAGASTTTPSSTTPAAPAPSGGGSAPSTSIPTYGASSTGTPTSARDSIKTAYDTLSTQITSIEEQMKKAGTKTDEEKQLEKDLMAKKQALAQFDVESLQRLENFQGQGRGATLKNVAERQDVERRTRALERLGMAGDAQGVLDQLTLAQGNRQDLSKQAQDALTLAGKKLDIALGLQDKLSKLDETERTQARQFLLDMVSFGKGKTFDELDAATQAEIIHNTANSPITLGMVKTALENGSLKADQPNLTALRTLGIQASSGGAPLDLVQAALGTGDPIKASAMLSTWLKGPTESVAKTGGEKPQFTTTQLNQGASNAGLDSASFKNLDGDVQNFFVNNKSVLKTFNDYVASVKDGSQDVTEVTDLLDGSNLPDTVKAYLKTQIQAAAPKANTDGGILSSIGNVASSIYNHLFGS